jgi:hypothetical protein
MLSMLDLRKGVVTRCPKGHETEPIFDVDTLGGSLDRGHVQCFCLLCGSTFSLSLSEQANVRVWLDGLKLIQ